jgi:hypothetical protein
MPPVAIVSRPPPQGTPACWERSVARIQAQGSKPPMVRWSVIRPEHDLRTVTHDQRAAHPPQAGPANLEQLGRTGRLTAWPYRQTVEAIQPALGLADVAGAPQFDWAAGQAAARPLPASPPPIARAVPPPTPLGPTEPLRTHGGAPGAGRELPAAAEVRAQGTASLPPPVLPAAGAPAPQARHA